MTCAPSEDSDQPGHLPSLIRVFAVHMKKPWVLSYPLSAQQRLWSDWADAQADLSLRWAHSHFVGFVKRRLMRVFFIFSGCIDVVSNRVDEMILSFVWCQKFQVDSVDFIEFLAHLSRRLTRWAYRMGLEPASVRACVRPHFQTWISPRPAGRLQPNFIWSIIGVGERLH